MTQPVNSNNTFSNVFDLQPNPLALVSRNFQVNVGSVGVVKGNVVPTSAGDYMVKDLNGNNLVLPPNAVFLCASAVSTTPLVGGTNALLGLSATPGGVLVGTPLVPITVTAVLNTGIVTPGLSLVSSAATNLIVVSTGVFTSGVLQVCVFYVNPLGF